MHIFKCFEKKNRAARLFSVCLCMVSSILVLICIAIIIRRKDNSQTDKIGDFKLPVMANWTKHVYRGTGVQNVRYIRKIGNTKVMLLFLCIPKAPEDTQYYNMSPDYYMSPENRNMIIRSLKADAYLITPLSLPGQKSSLSIKEEKSRYGLTITGIINRTSETEIENERETTFIYKENFYGISYITVGKVYSSEAISVAETGWQTLWKGMELEP